MRFLRFLAHEAALGTLVALLSVFTAVASYQGAMADGMGSGFEVDGMKNLNDGNAEYLRANLDISRDYDYYDNWYFNQYENPELAEYYQGDFTDALKDAIARESVWDDQYYVDMYVDARAYFEASNEAFKKAGQWGDRSDRLQLVMLIMALGLAFAAWASLLKEESRMRMVFAFFATLTLIAGLSSYLTVPPGVA
jgi:hypothetical protein